MMMVINIYDYYIMITKIIAIINLISCCILVNEVVLNSLAVELTFPINFMTIACVCIYISYVAGHFVFVVELLDYVI